jgi:hypothetical protein
LRRHPLIPILVVLSGYLYLVIREAGRLLSGHVLGIPMFAYWRYGVMPAFEIDPLGMPNPGNRVAIMISGPVFALLVGYLLLAIAVRARTPGKHPLRLLLGFTCYMTLVLDAVYFTIGPLARLGGEPEMLRNLLDIGVGPVVAVALAVLVVNLVLIRTLLIPFLKK